MFRYNSRSPFMVSQSQVPLCRLLKINLSSPFLFINFIIILWDNKEKKVTNMLISRLLIFFSVFFHVWYIHHLRCSSISGAVQKGFPCPHRPAICPLQRHHLCLLLRYLYSTHAQSTLLFRFLYTFSTFFFLQSLLVRQPRKIQTTCSV